jgi:hypothetical protein
MKFDGDDGSEFELVIIGYQFPSATDHMDATDRNWLVLRGRCMTTDGFEWVFTDPCMLTTECPEVVVWFAAVAQALSNGTGKPANRGLEFIEPHLWFELVEANSGWGTLLVRLSHESGDPRTQPDSYESSELRFRVTAADCLRAAEDWRQQADRFPER